MMLAVPVQTFGWLGFLAIAIAVNATYFVRRARINAARRGHGFAGLSEEQVSALKRLEIAPQAATPVQVSAADALIRQMAWEKFEAQSEMIKNGRALSRGFCSVHDRWCKYPDEPHPSGGNRNTEPPAGWQPTPSRVEGEPRRRS